MSKKSKIKRRKEARRRKTDKKFESCHSLESVFTLSNFVSVLGKCKAGVMWKDSVQEYAKNCMEYIYIDCERILSGELVPLTGNKMVKIYERGKARVITPVKIRDRMIQRVLCDYCLVPIFSNKLIYDNGASMQGKGVEFSRRRIHGHLCKAIKSYGTEECYALVFDFKDFFGSIKHSACREILEANINDQRIVELVMHIIKSYKIIEVEHSDMSDEDKAEKLRRIDLELEHGICLGSQVSQIMALAVPNEIDHYIKDQMGIKHYVRYMDDGVVLHNNKETLMCVRDAISRIGAKYGLNLNLKKTYIVKVTKGFKFMKVNYKVDANTGKITRTLAKTGIHRMRRKLKKFRRKLDNGEMTIFDIRMSFQSWLAHSKIADSYRTVGDMIDMYESLFGRYEREHNMIPFYKERKYRITAKRSVGHVREYSDERRARLAIIKLKVKYAKNLQASMMLLDED